MKKIMILGGGYYQIPVTKAAKKLGCTVISVDYLPDNPAHQYADEYYNVSTVDKDAVLSLAKCLKIDGICTYASDVSAPTAAYVATSLGLPTNPYESVQLLTQKHLTHQFLETNGFAVPRGRSFNDMTEAYDFFQEISTSVVIKPVDSSGSKGISKIDSKDAFPSAYNNAMSHSLSKRIIVEEFIEKAGYQITGDCFFIDGKLVFAGLMDNHFDSLCNPLAPIGASYPTILSEEWKRKILREVERFLTLLKIRNGAVNIDVIVGADEKIYIIEVGPRNGGNGINDTIRLATGIDLAEYAVKSALGIDCRDIMEKFTHNSFVATYILHSRFDGIFDELWFHEKLKKYVTQINMFVNQGDEIHSFLSGRDALGTLLMKFDSTEEMNGFMDHMDSFLEVRITEKGVSLC